MSGLLVYVVVRGEREREREGQVCCLCATWPNTTCYNQKEREAQNEGYEP